MTEKLKKVYAYEKDVYRRRRMVRKFNQRYGEDAFDDFVKMLRDGETLQKIGDRFGFTRERARQLRNMLCNEEDLGKRVCEDCGSPFIQLNLTQKICSRCSKARLSRTYSGQPREPKIVLYEIKKMINKLDILQSTSITFRAMESYLRKGYIGDYGQNN